MVQGIVDILHITVELDFVKVSKITSLSSLSASYDKVAQLSGIICSWSTKFKNTEKIPGLRDRYSTVLYQSFRTDFTREQPKYF